MLDPTAVEERSLDRALDELDTWITDGDYDRPVALVNAVDALYRVHQRERRRAGKEAFDAAVAAHSHGDTLAGVVWARGVTLHAAEAEADIEGSRPFTLGRSSLGGRDTLGGGGIRIVWRPLADLPARRGDRYGGDTKYGSAVAGRSIVATLLEARDVLASIP